MGQMVARYCSLIDQVSIVDRDFRGLVLLLDER